MYENSLNLLKTKEIEFARGLTLDELKQIENIYQIKFPSSLREFLMMALPISKGFYNWRNLEEDNIMFIKEAMNRPIEEVYELAEEIYWCDDWGQKPEDEAYVGKIVRDKLKNAPRVLPIYGHRYIPVLSVDNPPIISIHDLDIIYYGKNLEDYLYVEFGNKTQNKIEFENITPIPFWSDIM